jgi:transposase
LLTWGNGLVSGLRSAPNPIVWQPAEEISRHGYGRVDSKSRVPLLPAPAHLSHPAKDALTARLALADQRIAAQDARIAALEARLSQLARPPKTPGNSSKPFSQGQKPDLPTPDHPPRKSRPGVGRTMHPNPDRTIDQRLTTCPRCEAVFPVASQIPQQVFERIELPPIRPDGTQIRLFGGRCACCGKRVTAETPAGLEQGSPFGHSIAAMVVYLHYAHAIGMERLALLMNELFSLSISEGAISNILARAREPLLDATAAIEKVVLASPVVCSDETSVRVKGKNWWEWVFIGTLAVLHTIKPSRGKAVVNGAVRRGPASGVGVGHARQPARPWRVVAGLPGASAARRDIGH